MSCCSFDGQGTLNKLDPQTQKITEAIYSDWTEAAGGPIKHLPANIGGGRTIDPTIFNPNDPDGQHRSAAAGDPWYTTLQGRSAINTSALRPNPYIPHHWESYSGQNFDGAAVKKNWVPLVVLGLSLVVGIGLSEWATKKYIK